jgi:hypothetical protein
MQIQVDLEEVKRVFGLLEELHDFVHQPLKYRDAAQVEAFVDAYYPEIKDLYYQVVWNWLPQDVQREITER